MFCSNCGQDAKDGNFCPACGTKIGDVQQSEQVGTATAPQSSYFTEEVIWEGKPSGLMDKAIDVGKLNQTYYKITNQRIVISTGLVKKKETEIEIRHIKDIQVERSLTDRIAKVGDITLYTTDVTEGEIVLRNVPNAVEVKEGLRSAIMAYRATININTHEKI